MNKLTHLLLVGFAAAIFVFPAFAQDDPPAQPIEQPETPPELEPDPSQPEPEPPVVPTPATNRVVPTPRLPPPVTVPSLPRQFPRPLGGATNYPIRPGATPTVRPAGPGTPNTAVNQPGAPGATGATAPTVVTNTIVGPTGDSTDIINFKNMPLDQFLDEYASIARRTVLRAANLPLQSQVNFKPASPLTPDERLQMYDTILALNGITMIPTGEKAVLAVPSQQAMQEGAAFANRKVEDYAEASQFVTHVIKVEHVDVQEAAETLKQFAKNQNGILALETTKTLVLRDYAINVKRMLEVLAKIDVEIEQEYHFEVIPIKFGKVEELYQTLNSVISGGGGGGGGVGTTGTGRVGGLGGVGGGSRLGGLGGTGSRLGGSGSAYGGRSSYGGGYYPQAAGIEALGDGMEPLFPQQATVPRPTTTTPGTTGSFQQRFSNLNRAGGQNPAQPLSAEASITADPRSNSLIVYANKKDMAQLKKIIEKVDTMLAQVLIEGVILEVGLTSGLSYGVSARQNYRQFNPDVGGGGSMDNLSAFGGGVITNLFPTIPTGGGVNYLVRLNDDINVVVQALASDANANVLQRPRIITSHAVEASFFAGSTIPFIQGTYYGGGSQIGTSSYYERQDVGVELSVIPYITPDGLVVMEVSQRIEEIAPNNDGVSTVANAPVTNKRSATSTISVRSGESVLLGGYIRASKAKGNSGVPILKDIPLLGNLFRSTTTDKARTELMILMRPTVLQTPEAAAELTRKYQQDSPQIRMMEQDFAEERERLNKAARKDLDSPLNSDGGLKSVFPMTPENSRP